MDDTEKEIEWFVSNFELNLIRAAIAGATLRRLGFAGLASLA